MIAQCPEWPCIAIVGNAHKYAERFPEWRGHFVRVRGKRASPFKRVHIAGQ